MGHVIKAFEDPNKAIKWQGKNLWILLSRGDVSWPFSKIWLRTVERKDKSKKDWVHENQLGSFRTNSKEGTSGRRERKRGKKHFQVELKGLSDWFPEMELKTSHQSKTSSRFHSWRTQTMAWPFLGIGN